MKTGNAPHIHLITLFIMALVVVAGAGVASAQTPDPGATGP